VCCPLGSCGPCKSCAMPGRAGNCMPLPAGLACAPNSCPNGHTELSVWTCDGQGACAATATTCAPYRCDMTDAACRTECANNGDCVQGMTCVQTAGTPGRCMPR
jgi:hypothetical protein